MASHQRSLKIPRDLADATEIRAKVLGFDSWAAYVKSLMRYDMMVQGPHTLTFPLSQLPLDEQDKVDAELLAETKKGGIGKRGQYLKHLLERMMKEKKKRTKKKGGAE